ncbi:MAG: serine hydrolase domain-containing protein [Terricaulis sp.]
MMNRRALAAGLAISLLGACATGQRSPQTNPPRTAWRQIDAAVASRVSAHRYAGTVFAIARGDAVLHEAAVGYADIGAATPMRRDTLFPQMSLTKVVTAVGVMVLVDEGKINLDAPVRQYLPELAGYELEGAPVTVRHLLTHTSGFGVFGSIPPATPDLTLAQRVQQLAEKHPSIRPGTRWQYSAFDGFDILARTIEVTSGQDYAAFLRARVFDPLGMHDATFSPTPAQRRRIAKLYGEHDGQLQPATAPFAMPAYPAGGGGLYASADDMLRLAQMLANHGARGNVRVLSAAAVAAMRSQQLAPNFPGLSPGLAWGLGVRVMGDPEAAHSALNRGAFGWSGAYGTHLWVDPNTGVAAVWMICTATGGGAGSPHAEEFEHWVMAALSQTA